MSRTNHPDTVELSIGSQLMDDVGAGRSVIDHIFPHIELRDVSGRPTALDDFITFLNATVQLREIRFNTGVQHPDFHSFSRAGLKTFSE